MYEVFLLCANGTVSLQLVMNVLRWIVLLYCIYRVRDCCLSVLGVLESPGKSWNFFVCKKVGTLNS